MKKWIALFLAVMMTLSLVACGTTEAPVTEAPAETAKITTITEGKLTVATSPDFAPYEFYSVDENGNATLAGFEVALAKYIADYLKLELEIIPMDFDGTLMELQNKTVDLGMAGYSPKPERAEFMDFSDIFYTGGQSFVCVKDNAEKFATLEDTNKAEYSIGAQIGSIQVDLAKKNSPNADIVELTKVTDLVAELLAGKLDGAYIETAVAETYAKNYPELCVVLPVPYEAEGSVIGVYKGNEALLKGVNEAIAAAIADGSMDQFVADANVAAGGNIIEGLLPAADPAAETPAEPAAQVSET
ncbi:MAG: transporter substrate-binding domain-containing protein [Oscillospiraceae bacterium]|nr:transporter substrate-binding domain-containing protein [Oscillospiraceae bacterium]MBR2897383.1 transporter substrate-binding domain-containing protein [Oscillospiraceae bacterium]